VPVPLAVADIDLTHEGGIENGGALSRPPILVMGDEASRDRVLKILDAHPSISRAGGTSLLPYLARVAGTPEARLADFGDAEPSWRSRVAGFFSSSQARYAAMAGKGRWAAEVPGHDIDEAAAFFPEAVVLYALGPGRPTAEVHAARRAGSRMGPHRYLEVAHVDLVVQPAQAARTMLEFLGEAAETSYDQSGHATPAQAPTLPISAADNSLLRQTALTDLARAALLGFGSGPLLDEAARLLQVALGAGTCRVYEFLAGGDDLEIRATASAPGCRPREAVHLTAPSGRGRRPRSAELVIPIGRSRPFGCLTIQAQEGARFDDTDRQFAVQVADILAAALQRLSVEEDRRLVALQDPLTGLPNRALIFDHLQMALARSQRRPTGVGVLFVDLDGFKAINDTMGHKTGDDVLIAVAHRLRAALRPPDTVGRLGGDEFVVICEDVGGEADAVRVAERLTAALAPPVRVAGRDIAISASIGVAVSASHTTDPAALLAEADGAMFWAKRPGRSVSLLDQRMRIGPGGDLVERLGGLLEEITEPDRVDMERHEPDQELSWP
jgi:diguanylate cyclase (GGDEF)-like protein